MILQRATSLVLVGLLGPFGLGSAHAACREVDFKTIHAAAQKRGELLISAHDGFYLEFGGGPRRGRPLRRMSTPLASPNRPRARTNCSCEGSTELSRVRQRRAYVRFIPKMWKWPGSSEICYGRSQLASSWLSGFRCRTAVRCVLMVMIPLYRYASAFGSTTSVWEM
jgi:hypothetical protein